MIPHHIYYQLVIVGLLWLCVMLPYVKRTAHSCMANACR